MKWKQIPGFSYYEVSELGDVRRSPNKRMRGWGPTRPPGGLLHPCYHDNKNSYLVVRMKDDADVNRLMKLHQIVALTFHGPRPTKAHCALHRDDNRRNHHWKNIYWGTKQQNAIDRSKNGLGVGKLSAEDALWIKELYFGDRRSYHELAEYFGVSPSSIAQIIKGKTYTWVGNALQNKT